MLDKPIPGGYGKAYTKTINGREYVSQAEYTLLYTYDSKELLEAIQDGLPHKTVGRTRYFNLEDCQAWHRGESAAM